MRVYSSDFWYDKYHKHILLAQQYTEIKQLSFIIKSCRLKPYDIVYGNSSNNLILHKLWVDEWGNVLRIIKKNRLEFLFNQLSIDRKSIVCTDMYHGLAINKIAKMSSICYIFSGLEEDYNTYCYYLCFLGIDNYLRCFVHMYDEWEQISPLYIGLQNLKLIESKKDIKYFIKSRVTTSPTACVSGSSWITSLPLPEKLKIDLERLNSVPVLDILL